MNMTKKNSFILIGAALLGIAAIVWFIIGDKSAPTADNNSFKKDEAIAVEVTYPTRQTVYDEIPYLGTVAGTKDGNLSFRIGGALETIHIKEGEKVQKGQLLATISVPELDAQLRRAQSEFEKAQSSKVFWEREAGIDSALYKEGAISQTAFNKTTFNYEQALSSFYAAKAALEEVQERKNKTQLKAPSQGTIGSILIREGSNIAANQPVFFFYQGEKIIYADVLEQDIQKGIKAGTPVKAKISTDQTITGRVERIDARAKRPFRSVRVFANFPDTALTDRPSGAGITLTFEINKQKDALLVPLSSIDLRGKNPRLLKVNGQQKVEAVTVKTGLQRDQYRQIEGSVTSSDKIISSGVNTVEPGDRVEIVREITINDLNIKQ